MKKLNLIMSAVLLLASMGANASKAIQVGGMEYEAASGSEATLTDCLDRKGVVDVPSVVVLNGKNYTVTSIGSKAFKSNKKLKKVQLPATVSHIGYKAFYNCKMLSDVNLPEGLTEVDEQALAECPALTSLVLPSTLTKVKDYAFAGNTKLTGIQVADANPAFVAVDGVLFDKQMTKLIAYPSGKPGGEYHVPNGVVMVCPGAFSFAVNLVSVSLPDGVVNLGENAFANCRSLSAVYLPYSITAIADGTFNRCSSLVTIDLPNSITLIGDDAFIGCTHLTSIVLPRGVATVGDDAFSWCDNLSLIVCEGPTPPSIRREAFSDDTKRNAVLRVPPFAFEQYSTAKEWMAFPHIERDRRR
jgi:hypothetical protein